LFVNIFQFLIQSSIKMEPEDLLNFENIYDLLCIKFRNNFSFDVQHQIINQKLVFNFIVKPSFNNIYD
jgi:hypothetical protein